MKGFKMKTALCALIAFTFAFSFSFNALAMNDAIGKKLNSNYLDDLVPYLIKLDPEKITLKGNQLGGEFETDLLCELFDTEDVVTKQTDELNDDINVINASELQIRASKRVYAATSHGDLPIGNMIIVLDTAFIFQGKSSLKTKLFDFLNTYGTRASKNSGTNAKTLSCVDYSNDFTNISCGGMIEPVH